MYLSRWIGYLDTVAVATPARLKALSAAVALPLASCTTLLLWSTSTATSTPRFLAAVNARVTAGDVTAQAARRIDVRAESIRRTTNAWAPPLGEKATSAVEPTARGAFCAWGDAAAHSAASVKSKADGRIAMQQREGRNFMAPAPTRLWWARSAPARGRPQGTGAPWYADPAPAGLRVHDPSRGHAPSARWPATASRSPR